MAGKLILCPTPIGNLGDVSLRMLTSIAEADLIAAEDTRRTLRLFNVFSIRKKPLISYHEHNKNQMGPKLIKKMEEGLNVTLVSDAGMPAISDPGADLVKLAVEANIKVESIPGPTAGITALTMSGLSTKRFVFDGFLPNANKLRRKLIESYNLEQRTIILYEAPHRLQSTLEELYEALGDRTISICKELTKRHESTYYFKLSNAVEYFRENKPRGEYVLLLEGISDEELEKKKREKWKNMPLPEHLAIYLSQGMTKKDAMKHVAKDLGVSKSVIYNRLLQ